MQALGVVPADPLDDGALDLVSVPPRALVLDQFGLEGSVEGLGHGVVIAIGDRADRRARARFQQPFAVADRYASSRSLRTFTAAPGPLTTSPLRTGSSYSRM